MACENQLLTGKTVGWAFSLDGTCESDPTTGATTPLTWLPLGLTQSFTENMEQRTTTANVDGETQTITETTGIDFSISLTSLDSADVAEKNNIQALMDAILTKAYETNPPQTPKYWVRAADSGLGKYRYYYCMANVSTKSGETEGNRTAEITFTGVPTNVPTNRSFQTEDIV